MNYRFKNVVTLGYGGKVIKVDGNTVSEKLKEYFEYLNELCIDETGSELSLKDVLASLDSQEFKDLFDKE